MQDLAPATKDVHRHILPTAALYSEAIVGRCCACEHAIVERQELEEQTIRLNNEAIKLENERLQGRLDKKEFERSSRRRRASTSASTGTAQRKRPTSRRNARRARWRPRLMPQRIAREERDWAEHNPPQSRPGPRRLMLWNFPVGKADLAPEQMKAIEDFVKAALIAETREHPQSEWVVARPRERDRDRGVEPGPCAEAGR